MLLSSKLLFSCSSFGPYVFLLILRLSHYTSFAHLLNLSSHYPSILLSLSLFITFLPPHSFPSRHNGLPLSFTPQSPSSFLPSHFFHPSLLLTSSLSPITPHPCSPSLFLSLSSLFDPLSFHTSFPLCLSPFHSPSLTPFLTSFLSSPFVFPTTPLTLPHLSFSHSISPSLSSSFFSLHPPVLTFFLPHDPLSLLPSFLPLG